MEREEEEERLAPETLRLVPETLLPEETELRLLPDMLRFVPDTLRLAPETLRPEETELRALPETLRPAEETLRPEASELRLEATLRVAPELRATTLEDLLTGLKLLREADLVTAETLREP